MDHMKMPGLHLNLFTKLLKFYNNATILNTKINKN